MNSTCEELKERVLILVYPLLAENSIIVSCLYLEISSYLTGLIRGWVKGNEDTGVVNLSYNYDIIAIIPAAWCNTHFDKLHRIALPYTVIRDSSP
jgi:hypothetical protein